MATLFSLLTLSLCFLTLASFSVSGALVYEDGYTVTTILDGNKRGINPYSVLPSYTTSSDLIVLDSSASSFYSLSFRDSLGVLKKYSGKGSDGFSDGELGSALFNKPKSFAVDLKGNLYVADKNNHAIRKISQSGVTTIAGGYSQKPGRADGPARNASFSDDFELNFIPRRCALIISDHGNKLIRQINLKAEDCLQDLPPVLGITSAWLLTLALGVACLFGLLAGFFIRPYVAAYGGSNKFLYSETWKHFLINLGRRVAILCFDTKSAIASSTMSAFLMRMVRLSMSYVTLMINLKKVNSKKHSPNHVSLIDSDSSCTTITKSQMYADQLQDLVSFGGGIESSDTSTTLDQTYGTEQLGGSLCYNLGKIEKMIQSNLICFSEPTESVALPQLVGHSTCAVRRNQGKGEKFL
ncbi:uncharacterized protein LOC141672468 isoform X2 [Apium graveolens]|uniref:uncharacterized protein LOC141672468 isoform X2 n=1 Tax=Apium graveolens TaxID=4045 RepID=UPI003D7AFBB7